MLEGLRERVHAGKSRRVGVSGGAAAAAPAGERLAGRVIQSGVTVSPLAPPRSSLRRRSVRLRPFLSLSFSLLLDRSLFLFVARCVIGGVMNKLTAGLGTS